MISVLFPELLFSLRPSARCPVFDAPWSSRVRCACDDDGFEYTSTEKDSRTFRVRIVYLNAAKTAEDSEVLGRLGIDEDWTEPLVSAPFIKLAGWFLFSVSCLHVCYKCGCCLELRRTILLYLVMFVVA